MNKILVIIILLLVCISLFSETGYEDLFNDLSSDASTNDPEVKENKNNFIN